MATIDARMSIIDFHGELAFYSRQVAEARRFLLTAARADGARAAGLVLGGGFERVQPDYRIARDGLGFIGVEYVVGGRGNLRIGGRGYSLSPGTLFIYDRRSPHQIDTDPDHPLAKYFIDLAPASGARALRAAQITPDRAWPVQDPPAIARLFEEILHYGCGSSLHRQSTCDSLLRLILLNAAPAPLRPAGTASLGALLTYQRCVRVIDAEAAQLRSLADLAERCELDPAYLCRLFRRFDRQTPYQRLARKRMELAAARLAAGNVTVAQLAADLGHPDAFNFSRTFKAVLGHPPSHFRTRAP
jgi:AraC-like DNA-binding protein